MKTMQSKDLVTVLTERSGVPFTTDDFGSLRTYLEDVSEILCKKYVDLNYLEERCSQVNVADVNVTLPRAVLSEIRKEFVLKFAQEDVSYCDDSDCYDDFENVTGETVIVNYMMNGQHTYGELLAYLQGVCKAYGGEITVEAATDDEQSYCKHEVHWTVSASGYVSNDSFFEINDDGADELVASVGWLCETFIGETFESFDALGVKLVLQGA